MLWFFLHRVAKREKYSRRRMHNDDADIDYINERNMKFNKKLERFYGAHTTEIKQNLERGTAVWAVLICNLLFFNKLKYLLYFFVSYVHVIFTFTKYITLNFSTQWPLSTIWNLFLADHSVLTSCFRSGILPWNERMSNTSCGCHTRNTSVFLNFCVLVKLLITPSPDMCMVLVAIYYGM